ncbi:hypothetical protein EVAR_59308_1 [Eumeta japonica]|uniref:Uncharacterized protein n=1 Tax=Eumeta variegata TaxID=151549 RepID=A0A4C1YBZ3_EUMVA|nr:hypothetical protein EVAR_59308_1 [Eumeta japonica]
MSHRTRERPAECLASLSHSTMIGLPRARSTRELVHSLQMYCKLFTPAVPKLRRTAVTECEHGVMVIVLKSFKWQIAVKSAQLPWTTDYGRFKLRASVVYAVALRRDATTLRAKKLQLRLYQLPTTLKRFGRTSNRLKSVTGFGMKISAKIRIKSGIGVESVTITRNLLRPRPS